jgi:hypothetical protein
MLVPITIIMIHRNSSDDIGANQIFFDLSVHTFCTRRRLTI